MPDFLVIGAPKAGTTALHAALARHPGLYMSADQGAEVLPVRRAAADQGRSREMRSPTGSTSGAGRTTRRSSTRLRRGRCAVSRLRCTCMTAPPCAGSGRRCPDARLIVIVRDPVERAHSNWTHLWSAGLEPVGDFVRACGEEDRRIAAGLGQLLALHRAWPLRRAARVPVHALPARAGPRPPLPAAGRRARARPWTRICAFLGVEQGRPGRDTAAERHGPPRTARSTHRAVSLAQRAGSAFGHAAFPA